MEEVTDIASGRGVVFADEAPVTGERGGAGVSLVRMIRSVVWKKEKGLSQLTATQARCYPASHAEVGVRKSWNWNWYHCYQN